MSENETNIFPDTSKVREAMAIINSLDSTKLKVILVRLAKAIDGSCGKQKSIFSENESQELQEHFQLTNPELNTFLGACSFILEQSAYHLVKPATLCAQLQALGMSEGPVTCIFALDATVK